MDSFVAPPAVGAWTARVMTELPTHYDGTLVALSVAIAIVASYAALDLARSIAASRGRMRYAWLVCGSLAMGIGIWSMHFVGMLALHIPGVPMAYDVSWLGLAVLVSIAGSWVALAAISLERPSRGRLALGCIALGAAIPGMHYLGMAAMRMPARIEWRPELVGLSIVIALAVSSTGLWVALRDRDGRGASGLRRRIAAAVVIGLAISGMHYTGMAAARFLPRSGPWWVPRDQVLATTGLSTAVALTILLVLCVGIGGAVLERTVARHVLSSEYASRRAREEGALRAFAHDLVAFGEMGETVRRIVQHASRIGRADVTFLELLRDDAVEVGAATGDSAPRPGARVPLAGSLTEHAQQAGAPAVYPDLAALERPLHGARCDGCSALLLPLCASDRPVGALVLVRRAARDPFGDADLVSAATVAELASLGILRAAREREREELLARVSDLYRQTSEALASRNELMAIVSHDLRNPLTAIDARAQALARRAPPDDPVHVAGEAIHRAARRMATLIDDLGDTAALVQGRLALQIEYADPGELLSEAAATFSPIAESKGLELRTSVGSHLPHLRCDRDRVLQVLSNLIGNAIQVTPAPGRICLRAEAFDGSIGFAVEDTGPGVPEAERERIFERHVRGAGASYRGKGLGLAIARGIVEAHGGSIWVESEPGRGSTFRFTLPVDARPTSGS